MNPDRNVQLIFTLSGKLTSTTSPVRRLLVVSVWGKKYHSNHYINDGEQLLVEEEHVILQYCQITLTDKKIIMSEC